MRRCMSKFLVTSALIICLTPMDYAAQKSSREAQLIDLTNYLNANSLFMFVTNAGEYGQDMTGYFGYGAGTFYPYVSIEAIQNGTAAKSPLYAAGIWMGGKVDGQLRVALAEFGVEYWPGPMSGGTFIPGADTSQTYRVYKIYSDSGVSNPNADYLQWPVSQGAPTGPGGLPLMLGDQTLFAVYNDANPARHTLIDGSTLPLGVEVRQTAWASDSAGRERVVYIEYQLFNRSSSDITDFYVSMWQDPDIGGAEDDLNGCDSLHSIFYAYNGQDSDIVYGLTPPALGVRILAGPVIASPTDTAYFFRSSRPGYRNLPMSSFLSYVNGDDAQSAPEAYNLMTGLKRNGSPLPNGTRFSYAGDPVAGIGDLDTFPANLHCLGSCGPITFAGGDSQYVLIKLAVGQGASRLASVTDLIQILLDGDNIPTGVVDNDPVQVPDEFALEQNYPNPFNPTTTIAYHLPRKAHVTLDIFNLLGQRVTRLINATEPAGDHEAVWSGCDDGGFPTPSGIYLYRLQSGGHVLARKMVLLR
jgi:hypothetical protein